MQLYNDEYCYTISCFHMDTQKIDQQRLFSVPMLANRVTLRLWELSVGITAFFDAHIHAIP